MDQYLPPPSGQQSSNNEPQQEPAQTPSLYLPQMSFDNMPRREAGTQAPEIIDLTGEDSPPANPSISRQPSRMRSPSESLPSARDYGLFMSPPPLPTMNHASHSAMRMEARRQARRRPREESRSARLREGSVSNQTSSTRPQERVGSHRPRDRDGPFISLRGASSGRQDPVEVIDVDALPDRPQQRSLPPPPMFDDGLDMGPSPNEIEITFARARFRSQGQHSMARHPQRDFADQVRARRAQQQQHTAHNNLNPIPPPFQPYDGLDMDVGHEDHMRSNWRDQAGQFFQAIFDAPGRMGLGMPNMFQVPQGLDYGMRAGIFGALPESPPPAGNNQPAIQEKPLPPVRDGFTRCPTSNDTIICPSCDDELGDAEEDDKRAIWVGKCGHCFCGVCAKELLKPLPRSRAQRGRKQGKPCPVDSCNTHFSGKRSLWEIYV